MNATLIVANLKSYKNLEGGKQWLENFTKNLENESVNKEIVVCPPFTLLSNFYSALSSTNVKIGAQDVSVFGEGPYTGEINSKQLKDFAKYVLIGHSERRVNFGETGETLSKKVSNALEHELQPIFMVQGEDNNIPEGVKIIAYEPTFAIGSGSPDTPQNANEVASFFKEKGYTVLYGGSVSSQNVKGFTSQKNLSGVLVGGASLDSMEFLKIIQNA